MKGKYFSMAVFDLNRKKLCDLYDSNIDIEGSAEDIKQTKETGGWKEQSFKLPTMVNNEPNFRLKYMCPEYQIRVIDEESDDDGDGRDWYIINEPDQKHSKNGREMTITAQHNSTTLKSKNLYFTFDDENGVDTIRNLVNKILRGTDWTLGVCDAFFEADSTTEKVRSLKSDGKDGAYQLILDVCELFMAYPVFHGDAKVVDIHAIESREAMRELNFGTTLVDVDRKRNSENIVTRLYVEGEYTDDGEYVGIESVNPTGQNFILNFDYYKDIGEFTDEHQGIVDDYLETASDLYTTIREDAANQQVAISEQNRLWGQIDYVVYKINGIVTDSYIGGDATESDKSFHIDDKIRVVKRINNVVTLEDIVCETAAEPTWPTGTVYAIKYLLPAAGTIGGKEVAAESKQFNIETFTEKMEEVTSDVVIQKYEDEIERLEQELSDLHTGAQGIDQLTYDACILAEQISDLTDEIKELQEQQLDVEADFVIDMGDLLRDGYWSNNNYIPGQEQALFDDALKVDKEMAKPEITYNINIFNLSHQEGHEFDNYKVNQRLRIYDPEMELNELAYSTKIERNINHPEKDTMQISTSELSAQRHSLTSSLSRMNEVAELVAQKKEIYARASSISENGTFATAALNGIIDVNRTQLLSSVSNWYTDENGNMIFESLDGGSAMMLSGVGFAIANTKRVDGRWNWRTFGNGNGFTADEINAGTLNAGQITILGTDDFFWDADSIRIYTDDSGDKQIRIGRYDSVHYGIGFTDDGGDTWKAALTSSGLVVTADSFDTDISGLFDTENGQTVIAGGRIKADTIEGDSIKAGEIQVSHLSSGVGASIDLTGNAVATKANKIDWIINSGTSSSNMSLTNDALNVIANNINLTGKVTFSSLDSNTQTAINNASTNASSAVSSVNSLTTGQSNGTTTINGGCLTTGTINANNITIKNIDGAEIKTNTITADKIDVTNLYVRKLAYDTNSAYMMFDQNGDCSYYTSVNGGHKVATFKYQATGFAYDFCINTDKSLKLNVGDTAYIDCGDFAMESSGDANFIVGDGASGNFSIYVGDDQHPNHPWVYIYNDNTKSYGNRWRASETLTADSDARLKSNIADIDNAVEIFDGQKPRQYHFNGETILSYGFVAQEVEEALDAVNTPQTVLLCKPTSDDDYYGLNYQEFIAILTAKIKAQDAVIKSIQERLDNMEELLNNLSANQE